MSEKYCVDCKHYQPAPALSVRGADLGDLCARKVFLKRSLVNGRFSEHGDWLSCESERDDVTRCGRLGMYFEPKA